MISTQLSERWRSTTSEIARPPPYTSPGEPPVQCNPQIKFFLLFEQQLDYQTHTDLAPVEWSRKCLLREAIGQ